MYDLFENTDIVFNGTTIAPEFSYIRKKYQHNLDILLNYYNEREMYVKSNHFLVRLLSDALIPIDYELERYMEVAYARSPFISKLYDLTSDRSYGIIHNSIFYNGSDEIILYEEDYIDTNVLKDWKMLEPVRVLKHPISDLEMKVPSSKHYHFFSDDVSVISINIPLLLGMYRSFVLDELSKFNREGSVVKFISKYVLPNMIISQTDIACFNRLRCLYYGIPFTKPSFSHALSLSDYSDKVDKVYLKIIKRLRNTNIRYSHILKNIPVISKDVSEEALLMPDIAPTRQVWWSLFLTRLDDIELLIDLGGKRAIKRNKDLLGKLNITLRHFKSDNVFNRLPEDLRDSVEYKLYNLSSLLDKL